ncbi:hypothetical protein G6F59_018816 [Rhizopus arrhizus]|nr:hypothetical protein G6F59_018816 [Rhizopus arrhizus]
MRFGHDRDGKGDGRQAVQAVHEGNQFRHLRHFDAARHQRADGAAHQQAQQDPAQAARGGAFAGQADNERRAARWWDATDP